MVVAVLNTNKTPLAPCHPAVARKLLRDGKAAVYRKFPFVIILKREVPTDEIRTQDISLNIDPGDTTGLALVTDDEIIWAAELGNRKDQIVTANKSRASLRRGRRSRKTRYRSPRFMNRNRKTLVFEDGKLQYVSVEVTTPKAKTDYSRVPLHLLRDPRFEWKALEKVKRKERDETVELKNGKTKVIKHRTSTRWKRKHAGTAHNQSRRGKHGWIPPSLRSPLFNLETWVNRFIRYFPISRIRFEKSSFDIAKMLNPDISGVAYQGEGIDKENKRAYVFRRDKHTCQYCGKKGIGRNSVPLNIDHVIPRIRGGTDIVTNLVTACVDCNQEKGNVLPHQITDKTRKEKVEKALKHAQKPMKPPTTMNILQTKRIELLEGLCDHYDIPLEFGYGSHTKHYRKVAGLPKEHYYDAACIKGSPQPMKGLQVFHIRPTGYGSRALFTTTNNGFPVYKIKNGNDGRMVSHRGEFAKFDMVRVSYQVKSGKNKGQYRKVSGVISSFENTNPNKCRVSVPLDIAKTWGIKENRVEVPLTDLTRIQRRDGYAYHIRHAKTAAYPRKYSRKTSTKITTDEITGNQLEFLF